MARLCGSLRLRSGWRNRHPQDQDLCVASTETLTTASGGAAKYRNPSASAWKSCIERAGTSLSRAEKTQSLLK